MDAFIRVNGFTGVLRRSLPSMAFVCCLILPISSAYAAGFWAYLKHSSPINSALIDAIQYSFLTPAQLDGEWEQQASKVQLFPSLTDNLTLLNAQQIRDLKPQLLYGTGPILIATSVASPDCKNIQGCAALRFDRSVIDDAELMVHIERVVRQPCLFIPDKGGEHWVGFFIPFNVARNHLDCHAHHPQPLNKVHIYDDSRHLVKVITLQEGR